ncbi:hypothetical protein M5D96_003849 [Drosophila gunungcola]|uniref:Uncharacterized protein n=1 Tax=Drosophila gunungcola TaxID=103775 RepID=A0A9P9YT04_9MUSC|nr:hypothetical protein M5D96_003849 [Drosophila gunungcola]
MNPGLQMQKLGALQNPFGHPWGQWGWQMFRWCSSFTYPVLHSHWLLPTQTPFRHGTSHFGRHSDFFRSHSNPEAHSQMSGPMHRPFLQGLRLGETI